MTEFSPLQLVVLAGGDPLRQERLTVGLLDALRADQAVTDLHVEVTAAPPPTAGTGSKGTVETVAALLIAGAPYARPVADALGNAIHSWCARDHRAVVRMTDGERSIEIIGSPAAAQRKLAQDFLHGSDTTS